MTKHHMIRGIVFDLDGVLLQSSACHRAAFEAVLRPLGVTDFDYRRYAGWRTADAIEDTLRGAGRLPDANTIAMLADAKSRLARVKLAASQPVPADCLPVLRQLSDCYRLALASSGSRRSVELFRSEE